MRITFPEESLLLLPAGFDVDSREPTFEERRPVQVRTGPLAGLKGVIHRLGGTSTEGFLWVVELPSGSVLDMMRDHILGELGLLVDTGVVDHVLKEALTRNAFSV